MVRLSAGPFKVGDVVYWELEPERHTLVTSIERDDDFEYSLCYVHSVSGEVGSWWVDIRYPHLCGIHILKRGDE